MSTSLRGSRVLITGGAGAIGSNLCDLVVKAGARDIVVLDNFVRGRRDNLAWAEANGPVQVIDGDICDRALVDELTQGIDIVFHQAAIRITQCAEEPRLAKDVMIDGTYNVLESAVRHNVPKVVAASSASVYGLAETFPTTEAHHPYANDTLYGAARCSTRGCSAASTPCTASTTWRFATSTSTGRGWTSTASTRRCWSAGWSGSRRASRR